MLQRLGIVFGWIALGLVAALGCGLCGWVHAAPRMVTLTVPGMTCAACPVTVKKALSRVDGVEAVDVSFAAKRATVTFEDTKTSVQALTQATADAGYPSSVLAGAQP
jgi:mercuric ion binding protein